MFAKIDVNGPDTHPLYRFLKREKRGLLGSQGIKWNFTKFLVDREGAVTGRYGSSTEPKDLAADIESCSATDSQSHFGKCFQEGTPPHASRSALLRYSFSCN